MTGTDDITTPRGLVIPAAAVSWSFARSAGAGGQNVNKASTKAVLIVDLTAVQGSRAAVRRVVAALGTELRVTRQSMRSQWANRQACLRAAVERIDEASRPAPPPRRPTRPPRGSVERRLESKRRQSAKKRDRRADD
ncbi:MAG: peptide chain release factor-like protein [Ilumatobacteraceae bacterium]